MESGKSLKRKSSALKDEPVDLDAEFDQPKKFHIQEKETSKTQEENEPSSKRQRKRPQFLSEEVMSKGPSVTKVSSRDVSRETIDIYPKREPLPTRSSDGYLHFPDYPEFTPNLTPKEVLQMGSFGGTYYRTIQSGVTGETYSDAWKEFPTDWFEGLNIKRQVTSQKYDDHVNTYKVSCGGDLHMWESSGWITEADPFGWFQWYCRFYLGRRCSDDVRQIGRALGVMGATGRWRRNLVNKVLSTNKPLEKVVDDAKISPKVRQLLQHWGYKLTMKDLREAQKRMK